MMKRCLIVFAKEPRKGQVKTRLSSVLTPQQSLDLYKAFVCDTLDMARKAHADQRIVAFDSGGSVPTFLTRIAPDFLMMKQNGRTLGDRLHNAFLSQADTGHKHVVIIGSDAPTLPARIIDNAFLKLRTHDIVLGPTLDGGYYLIGLKRPCKKIFEGIRWSSSGVFSQTIAKARNYAMRIGLLNEWFDVDDEKTLALLIKDLKEKRQVAAGHSRRALRCMNLKAITPLL